MRSHKLMTLKDVLASLVATKAGNATSISIEFIDVTCGTWAIYRGRNELRAFGYTRKEAEEKLVPLIVESLLRTMSSSAPEISDEDMPADPRMGLPDELLRDLAKKHKPAQSWYEEDFSYEPPV